ncbi:hypothetical protein DICSQDRAFT_180405 [Dichomitus squalens LYAD-421 SS1]|uniref:Uncharacterized protein n=1 Tax=Dichomitus squalens (strain LYAD-421) TaxID=732165 RepID=R7T151_DICSQ|nr:uncharacterized protein DICSQDRAFT_180405 [Dichomitus squalens LYAD-421 SS1]EJF62086.1 hypothetical protein DICSQDRAFT_180405 [Dichomitus squalens LYAD-421 SS1]
MYPKHLRSGSPKPQASTASSAAPESSQIDQSTVIDTSFGVKLRFGLDITSPAASRMLDGRSHRYPVTHPKVEHSTNEHSLTLLSSFSQDLAPSPELTALAVAPLAPPAFHDISQTQCRSCPIVIAPNNFGREPDLQATPMRRPRTRSPSVWALAPRSWRLLRAKGDRPMVTLTVPSPPGAPLPLPHIHEQHLNPEPMSPENDTQQSPPPDQHRRQYSNVDGDDLESDDEDDSWIPRQRVEQYSVSHDIAQTICSAAIEGEFIQDEIILRPHIETPLHWKEQRDEPLAGPSVRRRRSPDTLELRTTSSYDRVNELIRALNTSEDLTDIALEPRPLRYRRVLHEFINPGFEAFQYRGGVGFLNPLDTAVDMIAEGRDHVKGPSDADHDIVDISDSESSQFESDEEVEPEREKSMVSPTDDQVRMGERSRDRTNTGNSWRSLATSEEYPQLPHLPLPQTVASRDLPPSPASVSAAQIHEAGRVGSAFAEFSLLLLPKHKMVDIGRIAYYTMTTVLPCRRSMPPHLHQGQHAKFLPTNAELGMLLHSTMPYGSDLSYQRTYTSFIIVTPSNALAIQSMT